MAQAGKNIAIDTLKGWFERDFRYAKWDRDVELVELTQDGTVRIRVYTDLHCFAISAHNGYDYAENEPRVEGRPPSYLGCIATTRKPRAGEDWNRGSDLHDGPLNERTWHRILADIVSYEMVKIHREDTTRGRGIPDSASTPWPVGVEEQTPQPQEQAA